MTKMSSSLVGLRPRSASAVATSPERKVRTFLALPVAVVLGMSVAEPTWALRQGAAVCAAVALFAFAIRWRPRLADALMLALVVLAWASQSWAESPAVEIHALNYLGVGAMFFAVRAVSGTTTAHLLLARGYLIGCVWAAIELLRGGDVVRFRFDPTAERFALDSATGASSNYLAYCFVAGAAVLAVVYAIRRPALLGRLAGLAFLVLMVAGINATGTRGAFVGGVMLLAWWVLQRLRPGRGWRALWIGAAGLNVAIVLGVADGWLARLAGTQDRDTGTLNGRLELWPLARESVLEHPLGLGAGAFETSNPLHAAAHNMLLDVSTGLGVAGLMLLMFVVYRVLVIETAGADPWPRRLVVGSFVAAVTPAVATGYWVESPTLWGLVGLISAAASRAGLDEVAHQVDRERLRRPSRGRIYAHLDRGASSSSRRQP